MLVSCVSAVTYHRRIAIAGVYIATAVVVHRVPALAYLPKLVLASVVIIAVIQLARSILSYVESKLKAFNNDLTKCLLCLCKCCLWCLEKFMRFINRNAYIVCAIKSTNFCSSAKTAFNL